MIWKGLGGMFQEYSLRWRLLQSEVVTPKSTLMTITLSIILTLSCFL